MIPIPHGYFFATVEAGLKYAHRKDLTFIGSDKGAVAAGVLTTNRFQAAPVIVAREYLNNNTLIHGLLINSGQANACTGNIGIENCRQTLIWAGEHFGFSEQKILPASTGVIGDHLPMTSFQNAISRLTQQIDQKALLNTARAIMTTDTFPKIAWRQKHINGQEIRVVGLAKGAGMICPQMATMLAFILTDADVDRKIWQKIIEDSADKSFNRISVDGDTSTNDCLLALANAKSGVQIGASNRHIFETMVQEVCQDLAAMIVQDAEGGTKVVSISIIGAKSQEQAESAARCIGHSPLVKTAFFGEDPNWGRIVAALGRSSAEFEPEQVSVFIAGIPLFLNGEPVGDGIEQIIKPYIQKKDIALTIDLNHGFHEYSLLTSDLTYDYIRINADYTS